ncbi:MAG TPA: rhodanese-like domain-containing protein [Anaerolineales bacterium]|nr:rhodanese-like domain-containing protein [Anaerolineales bacterium]
MLWLPKPNTATMVVILEPTFPPQPSDLPATENDVPRVSLEEALVALNAGAAVIVDVRSPDSFASSHIAGAATFPSMK